MTCNTTISWLFPGQGSQEVGMGSRILKKYARAKEILRFAEEISGLPLSRLVSRGPADELTRTEVVQPSIVAISCAYVDLLRDAGEKPLFVAGHSLGEISALYAGGVIDLADALRLAAERGRLMSTSPGGGMIAVKGVDLATIESAIGDVRDGIVCLANINAPSQIVVSGDEDGLRSLIRELKHHGAESIRLNVSGAWHSPLVAVASHEFERHLAVTNFANPIAPIAMGSTAQFATSGEQIKAIMSRQMVRPVYWHETINLFRNHGCHKYFEVGCGKVLKGLMRRIFPQSADCTIQGLESAATVDRLIAQREERALAGEKHK